MPNTKKSNGVKKDVGPHPYEFMYDSESSHFTANISSNPFRDVDPLDPFGDRKRHRSIAIFFRRLNQTFGVLNGHETVNGRPNKIGISRYLLGTPVKLAHMLIPGFFYLLTLVGREFFKSAGYMLKHLPAPLKVLLFPLWLSMGIVGLGIGAVGFLGYGITKPILYVADKLMQKIIVPAVSCLLLVALIPVVGIVHLFLQAKEGRDGPIKDRRPVLPYVPTNLPNFDQSHEHSNGNLENSYHKMNNVLDTTSNNHVSHTSNNHSPTSNGYTNYEQDSYNHSHTMNNNVDHTSNHHSHNNSLPTTSDFRGQASTYTGNGSGSNASYQRPILMEPSINNNHYDHTNNMFRPSAPEQTVYIPRTSATSTSTPTKSPQPISQSSSLLFSSPSAPPQTMYIPRDSATSTSTPTLNLANMD